MVRNIKIFTYCCALIITFFIPLTSLTAQDHLNINDKVIINNIQSDLIEPVIDTLHKLIQSNLYKDTTISIQNYIVEIKPTLVDSIYTIKSGDWLSKIAGKPDIYGKGREWIKIYEANKSIFENPDKIYAGLQIVIPEVLKYTVNIKNESVDLYSVEVSLKNDSTVVYSKKKDRATQLWESLEIEGIIVNETQTKVGNDFYQLFFNKWETLGIQNTFAIFITEKISPSFGTQIIIKINEFEVYQQFLQPRQDIIEDAVEYGIQYSLNYMENYDMIQEELNGKDLKGTGVF